jgi:hypothetical protein
MKVGQALKSKEGKTYLKFDKDVNIKAGEAVFLSRPQDDIDYLVSKGELTPQQGEERKAKVPSFVLYNIKLAKPKG